MIQDSPADVPPSLFAPRAAAWLGLILILGIAALLALAVRDHNRWAEDETHEEVTAVGDQSFFKLPSPSDKPDAAVSLHGQPFFPVFKRIGNHDSNMIRTGEDDSNTYRIYAEHPTGKAAAADSEKKDPSLRYLKIATDEYVEIRPQK